MPIPQPNAGETQDDFISRCMANQTMNSDYPDSSQRYAVCIDQVKKDQIAQAAKAFIDKISKNEN
jgi:hypothetical protein